jgi:hypothetical protein
MNKKIKKLSEKHCFFCKEDNPAVLDLHRICEGHKGGKYIEGNVVVVCSNCHRKIHHSNDIVIDKWVASTNGMVLHCWVNGEEKYI